jgi:type IV secretory pathway VirB10-like protein
MRNFKIELRFPVRSMSADLSLAGKGAILFSFVRTIAFAFLLVAVSASAQTNQQLCCRYPLRGFGGASAVNLTPLFQWWIYGKPASESDSQRPLSAWNRVVGTKAGDLGQGWIVNAEIYTTRTTHTKARIVLQNPPVREEQDFDRLKQQVLQYGLQVTNAQRAYQTALKAEKSDQTHSKSDARSRNVRARNSAVAYSRKAAQEQSAASNAQNQEKEARQALVAAQKILNEYPSSHGVYLIDWFALDTGKKIQGLPVYDVGTIGSTSP